MELLLIVVLMLLFALVAGSIVGGGTYLASKSIDGVFHTDLRRLRLPLWSGLAGGLAVMAWFMWKNHCLGAC